MKELDKYFVIPVKYMANLDVTERKNLKNIILKIQALRFGLGKKDPNYIVCKDSEPYASDVWELILSKQNVVDDISDQMMKAHDELEELDELEKNKQIDMFDEHFYKLFEL